jgi:GntR family transcriptional regulator
LLLNLDQRSNIPIWEQVVNQIKEMVLKGILLPNDKLLSVRELSSQLVVNPNTISKAYQELERQGLIETLRGKGTFVSPNITPKADEKQIEKMKQSLKLLVVESSYLGIKPETFRQWTDEYLSELGGEQNVRSTKSK